MERDMGTPSGGLNLSTCIPHDGAASWTVLALVTIPLGRSESS
jgi:hypothetical protein